MLKLEDWKRFFNYLKKINTETPFLKDKRRSDAEQIIIVSDYSPQHCSYLQCSSFLIFSDEEMHELTAKISKFKEDLNIPRNAFFESKTLQQDGNKLRNQKNFVEILDSVNGTLLVFITPKSAIFSDKNQFDAGFFGKFPKHIFAQKLETFAIILFIMNSIKENVVWLSDEDSRIGESNNELMIRDSLRILKRLAEGMGIFNKIELFSQKDFKTKDCEFQSFIDDRNIKSIVDLSTGSFLNYFCEDHETKKSSIEYCSWFEQNYGVLNKKLILVKELSENGIKIF